MNEIQLEAKSQMGLNENIPSSLSPISSLPQEIILQIFGNLSSHQLLPLQLVCKQWQVWSRDTIYRKEKACFEDVKKIISPSEWLDRDLAKLSQADMRVLRTGLYTLNEQFVDYCIANTVKEGAIQASLSPHSGTFSASKVEKALEVVKKKNLADSNPDPLEKNQQLVSLANEAESAGFHKYTLLILINQNYALYQGVYRRMLSFLSQKGDVDRALTTLEKSSFTGYEKKMRILEIYETQLKNLYFQGALSVIQDFEFYFDLSPYEKSEYVKSTILKMANAGLYEQAAECVRIHCYGETDSLLFLICQKAAGKKSFSAIKTIAEQIQDSDYKKMALKLLPLTPEEQKAMEELRARLSEFNL